MAAPSFDELFNLASAEMQLRRPDLFLAAGDTTDFIVAMSAAMADKVIQFAVGEMRKTFFDSSFGEDLATLADDRYAIQKTDATAASVSVEFDRPSAGGGEPSGTIDAGFVIATEVDENGDRVEFTTDAAVSWTATEVATKTVNATASVAGRTGNVAALAVSSLVGTPFDSTITVSNPLAAAGGNEEETDAELLARVRAFPSTLRRATLGALEYGALQVNSVRVATAVEDDESNVTVFVTDSDVADELLNWRAAGITVSVVGGAVLSQAIDYSLTVKAGTNVAGLEAGISAAITARMARLPVSDGTVTSEGILYRHILQAAIVGIDPEHILAATINEPAADVVPPSGQVIRAGGITRS